MKILFARIKILSHLAPLASDSGNPVHLNRNSYVPSATWVASSHEIMHCPWQDLNLQRWEASGSKSMTLTIKPQMTHCVLKIKLRKLRNIYIRKCNSMLGIIINSWFCLISNCILYLLGYIYFFSSWTPLHICQACQMQTSYYCSKNLCNENLMKKKAQGKLKKYVCLESANVFMKHGTY